MFFNYCVLLTRSCFGSNLNCLVASMKSVSGSNSLGLDRSFKSLGGLATPSSEDWPAFMCVAGTM
jgi:hypothetical protein